MHAMTKCRVELDEFNNDYENIQRDEEQFSLFDDTDDVEELGPESFKRADGTYTGNPTMDGYIARTEQFTIESDFRRDK